MRFSCIAVWTLAALVSAYAQDGTITHFPASGTETERLIINGVMDFSALNPLILDFQAAEPGIAVQYAEYLANDLDREATGACAEGRFFGDLLLSSAVDQLVKAANDGCATAHVSAQTRAIPIRSTYWRDEVFGFTYEPAVIVYNKELLPAADVPRTRGELADLLRRHEAEFSGRVATYNLRQSALGFLFAFMDAQQNSTAYGRLLESMSRVDVLLRCCSASILDDISSGRVVIGYNLLGSYAYAASLADPKLGIVLPRDYTLVLNRAAMIPLHAQRPGLAGRFIDYLLSERGRGVGRQQSYFFSRDDAMPQGVDGPTSLIASGVGRAISIRPALLVTQDPAQRERFIDDWTSVVVPQIRD
ncbi:MAG: ABC transporter substrate-binding protein [Cypionkella sp.]